ncbi:hypothetical protein HY792_03520 [Candidatus Desantisbacteria bacterium]|nr:hypothetical protein [Candidatus Desantisbacteria bacterium]
MTKSKKYGIINTLNNLKVGDNHADFSQSVNQSISQSVNIDNVLVEMLAHQFLNQITTILMIITISVLA